MYFIAENYLEGEAKTSNVSHASGDDLSGIQDSCTSEFLPSSASVIRMSLKTV